VHLHCSLDVKGAEYSVLLSDMRFLRLPGRNFFHILFCMKGLVIGSGNESRGNSDYSGKP